MAVIIPETIEALHADVEHPRGGRLRKAPSTPKGQGAWSLLRQRDGRAFSRYGTAGPFRILRGSATMRRKLPRTEGASRPCAVLPPRHFSVSMCTRTPSRPGSCVPSRASQMWRKSLSDDDAVRRLSNPRRLRACYEAGPTGYELCRLLRTPGVACEVIAPSLIPTAPGTCAPSWWSRLWASPALPGRQDPADTQKSSSRAALRSFPAAS